MKENYKAGVDEWGTTKNEAYVETPHYREAPPKKASRQGSGPVQSLGGLLMLAGIGWGVYMYITGDNASHVVLQKPIIVCAVGVLVSIFGRFF